MSDKRAALSPCHLLVIGTTLTLYISTSINVVVGELLAQTLGGTRLRPWQLVFPYSSLRTSDSVAPCSLMCACRSYEYKATSLYGDLTLGAGQGCGSRRSY